MMNTYELLAGGTCIDGVDYHRGDVVQLSHEQAVRLLRCGAVGELGTLAEQARVDGARDESRRAAAVAALRARCPDLDAGTSEYAKHLSEAILAFELAELEERQRQTGQVV